MAPGVGAGVGLGVGVGAGVITGEGAAGGRDGEKVKTTDEKEGSST